MGLEKGKQGGSREEGSHRGARPRPWAALETGFSMCEGKCLDKVLQRDDVKAKGLHRR